MMKKTKNIGAILLASATLLGTAACGGGSEKEDPTKTYLDVGVFNAGLGTAYFDELKKDFEACRRAFRRGKNGRCGATFKEKYRIQSAESEKFDEKPRSGAVYSGSGQL